MTPALTVKSRVTIPKAIREFLGLKPGERVRFEPMPDGRVAMTTVDTAKANANKAPCPFEQFLGTVNTGMTTDELMRMTRGDDWNQP